MSGGGWATRPLHKCGELRSGGTPSKSNQSFWNGELPWFSSKEIKAFTLDDTELHVSPAAIGSGTTLVPEGTVLFVVRGMSLAREFRIGVTTRPSTFNQDVKALVPASDVDSRYLARYLRWLEPKILASTESSTHGTKRLPSGAFESLPIPLPPLPEQRRIADILDKADAIRRKRKEAIALTEQLLRSTFLEMFGDPVTNPKGWPVKPLGELADVNRGKFSPRPRNDPRFYGGRYPFIQTGELRNTSGYLRAWKQTLNEDGRSVSRGFERGSIAIAIAANIGDTAIVDFDFYCPDSVVGISARECLATNEFLEMTLRLFQTKLISEAPETAQKNINLETLRPLPIPAPPLRRQQNLSEIYRATYRAILHMDTSSKASHHLFSTLAHRAFSGTL